MKDRNGNMAGRAQGGGIVNGIVNGGVRGRWWKRSRDRSWGRCCVDSESLVDWQLVELHARLVYETIASILGAVVVRSAVYCTVRVRHAFGETECNEVYLNHIPLLALRCQCCGC